MIYISRPAPPASFSMARLPLNNQFAIDEYLAGKRLGFPLRTSEWDQIPGFAQDVRNIFKNKCAYCELSLDQSTENHLDRFRPQYNTISTKERFPTENNYYLWLAWKWSNLYLACEYCIRNKDAYFPIEAKQRAEPFTYGANYLFAIEQPMLLDPCRENPLVHLEFDEYGGVHPKAGSKRGRTTIDILNLNREDLCIARRQAAGEFRALWDKAQQITKRARKGASYEYTIAQTTEELHKKCASNQPFAGMKRQLLQRWLEGAQHNPNADARVLEVFETKPWNTIVDPEWENEIEIADSENDFPPDYFQEPTPPPNLPASEPPEAAPITPTPTPEVMAQMELLSDQRQTLQLALRQIAKLGEPFAPPGLLLTRDQARRSIANIKKFLQKHNIDVEDFPGELPE